MLKRLLTAVLVLGLFLALSGTAFSAPGDVPGDGISKKAIPAGGPGNANKKVAAYFDNPAQARGMVPVPDNTPVSPRPQTNDADTLACYDQDYYLGNTAAYRINMYDAGGAYIGDEIATRFDNTQAPTHKAEIDVVYGVIRYAARAGGAPGLPVRITVYEDAGGFPGAVVYSEDYTLPLVTAATWFAFTPTTPVVVSGAYYHVSMGYGAGAVATDQLALRCGDPNTTNRSSYYFGGWMTMTDAFGSDLDLWIATHQCEFYTQCYRAVPLPPPGYFGALVDMPASYFADGSTLNGISQYFSAIGPETLTSVRVRHYDFSGSYPGMFYSGASTNGFDVKIYPDDGSGNVDYSGGPLATVNVAGGPGLFPATGLATNGYNIIDVDFSSFNLVMFGGYHVAVQMTSDDDADGVLLFPMSYETAGPYYTDGTGASVNFTAPGAQWQRQFANTTWMSDPNGYGKDYAFFIQPTMCKDEFALCQIQPSYGGPGITTGFDLPKNIASLYSGEAVNRLEKVRVMPIDPALFGEVGGAPTMDIIVWAATPAGPGAELARYPIPTITYFPGWTELVIPGGLQILGDFYVGYENTSADPINNYWYYGVEEDAAPQVRGGAWYYSIGSAMWRNLSVAAGLDENATMEAEFCSIPPTFWVCQAASDFRTAYFDQGHTSHTNTAMTDAYCDLNQKWYYLDPAAGSTGANGGSIMDAGPIIFENYVITSFNSKYLIHDLATGAVVHTINANAAPYFISLNGVRCIPTVATVTIGGTPKPVLFVGGGSNNAVTAIDMSAPGFPAIWNITNANRAAKGYPVNLGNTGYASFIVGTVGGNEVVFFATNAGLVWAADAETGDRVWGPTTLVGGPFRNLAFDGAFLYTACISTPPATLDGDVYKLDALTGAISKQLSTAGGYKGDVLQPGNDGEVFVDHLALYKGEVYATSAWLVLNVFPNEAIFYRINAADFSVLSATPTGHLYIGGGIQPGSNLMVDESRVILLGGNSWTSVPLGGVILAYNRATGGAGYVSTGGGGTNGVYYGTGFLTCEFEDEPELLFAGNSTGYLSVFNADNGQEIFHRRLDNRPLNLIDNWAGGAISDDGIVVFATMAGQLFAFEKTVDVARIEVVTDPATAIVPYGNAPSVLVPVENVFTNTGCVPLTGTIHILDAPNGSPAMAAKGSNVIANTATIAEVMTENGSKLLKNVSLESFADISMTPDETSLRSVTNRAAAAFPYYLNGAATIPFTLNPGDTADITFDVNQSVIVRGQNTFWVEFESNDPNYFLDVPAQRPQAEIRLIAGCLIDTTFIKFGASSANYQAVTNTGRLGTGDWAGHQFGIAGDQGSFYQGLYLYGISRERMALNSQDWTSGGALDGEDGSWRSLQADPNLCNDDCKPALLTAVPMGEISSDGITYSPLAGEVVCKTYIDSVQNMDDGTGWNWTNYQQPFDDTLTMGLMVQSRTFGAKDVPAPFTALNDVAVEVMKVFHRYNQALADWKFGYMVDYDIGDDTASYSAGLSSAWAYTGGTQAAGTNDIWGVTKIPFGTGYTPLINAKALDAEQAAWETDSCRGSCFVDSAYYWMANNTPGQAAVSAAGDQEMFATLAAHDFVPGDTFQFAVAHFSIKNVADPKDPANIAPYAQLANKWLGFGRGDVNNDGIENLADIVYLADFVALGPSPSAPGPIPFKHLGDVNADDATNAADVTYLVDYYFHFGPGPVGKFMNY